MSDIILKKEFDADMESIRSYIEEVRHTKTPEAKVKYRPGKAGKQFKYINRIYCCEQLDEYYPLWQFELIPNSYKEENEVCMIMGRLSIIDPTSKLPRRFLCVGQEEIKFDSKTGIRLNLEYAKMAETDCLKRCASMLGIANDVYSDDIDIYDTITEITEEKQLEYEKFVTLIIPKMLQSSHEGYKILKQINSYFTGKADINTFIKFYGDYDESK